VCVFVCVCVCLCVFVCEKERENKKEDFVTNVTSTFYPSFFSPISESECWHVSLFVGTDKKLYLDVLENYYYFIWQK